MEVEKSEVSTFAEKIRVIGNIKFYLGGHYVDKAMMSYIKDSGTKIIAGENTYDRLRYFLENHEKNISIQPEKWNKMMLQEPFNGGENPLDEEENKINNLKLLSEGMRFWITDVSTTHIVERNADYDTRFYDNLYFLLLLIINIISGVDAVAKSYIFRTICS